MIPHFCIFVNTLHIFCTYLKIADAGFNQSSDCYSPANLSDIGKESIREDQFLVTIVDTPFSQSTFVGSS